jgi:hypothetical protein
MSEAVLLPPGFEDLEPFVPQWALSSAAERSAMRAASDQRTLGAFYHAAKPRLQDALNYLDGKPIADHGTQDDHLMKLMLSLAHVSLAVEVQSEAEPISARDRRHMRITRATADI